MGSVERGVPAVVTTLTSAPFVEFTSTVDKSSAEIGETVGRERASKLCNSTFLRVRI